MATPKQSTTVQKSQEDQTSVASDSALPSATAPVSKPAKQGSSGKGLSVFSILLSLGALAGSGYTWYQIQVNQVQSNTKLAVGVADIGGQVSRLGDSVARLQQQQINHVNSDQVNARLQQGLAPLEQKQHDFDELLQKMNANLQKSVDAFVVDEVSQLLKIANHSINFSGNTGSALKALSLADSQLKQLSDPRYSTVRSKINEEITQLTNVQKVDVEGLSVILNTISELVPSLPLANEPETKPIEQAHDVVNDESVTWRTELSKVWRDIKGAIQVQRIDQPPRPLLVPEQRYFLNQNLQLNLSKAELALLQSEPALFKKNLGKSIAWLNEYFDTKDVRVDSVIKQLTDLKNTSVDVSLPVISGSFDVLQTVLGR